MQADGDFVRWVIIVLTLLPVPLGAMAIPWRYDRCRSMNELNPCTREDSQYYWDKLQHYKEKCWRWLGRHPKTVDVDFHEELRASLLVEMATPRMSRPTRMSEAFETGMEIEMYTPRETTSLSNISRRFTEPTQ